jgi:hypothetical protein
MPTPPPDARDTLILLRPDFLDQGTRWFCPYSAQVRGMLAYYPELADSLEVVEVDFARPRELLAELLGDGGKSLPVLVLHESSPTEVAGVNVAEAQGRRYVDKTIEILRYLAVTRGTSPPH